MSDHTDMPMAPSGAMSPVDTSSPTTITTRASIPSGGGSGTGGGTRLGPRMISIRFAADWTGTSFDAAADAIRWLAKNDFLIKKEELEAKNDHDHGAYVYRLGDGR